MFCENCGTQLSDNARFCNGCGYTIISNAVSVCKNCSKQLESGTNFCDECGTAVSGVNGTASKSAQPVQPTFSPIAVNTTTIMARSFRCSSCGNSLEIPKNSRGQVRCPFCKNDCILDGIVKNAEIAAKENISSGIPFLAPPSVLHRQLVSLLSESPYVPLDVFEKIEVVQEKRYCIPSYSFECIGEASFTYQVAEERTQTYTVDRGDSVEIRERTHIDWKNNNSSANISETVFVSGNKAFAQQVEQLYMLLDPNKLVDIEELEYPHDVETYNFNLPQLTAFNEYIKPYVDQLLQEDAVNSLQDKNVRNFSMGNSRIQKELSRVFLGIYHIIYRYEQEEYSMWVTGTGEQVMYDQMPTDLQREQAYKEKQDAIYSVPTTKKIRRYIVWAFIIAFILLITKTTVGVVLGIGILIGSISFGIMNSIKKKKYEEQRVQAVKDLADFEAPRKDMVQQFGNQKKALRGIYQNVSGDSNAF